MPTRRIRRAARAALVAALAAAAPGVAAPLHAQAAEAAARAACTYPPATADSVAVVLHARLQRGAAAWDSTSVTAPLAPPVAMAARLFLQELRPLVRLPARLEYVIGEATPYEAPPGDPPESGRGVPDPETRIALTLHASGRVSDVAVERVSVMPAVDAALVAALQAPDAADRFGGLLIGVADSMRFVLSTGLAGDTATGLRAPLFRARLPVYALAPVRIRHEPVPRYPEVAARARVADSITAQFVVDERGVPDLRTLRFTSGTYREFGLAVTDALRRHRFEPATIAGCPVRQLVSRAFVFKLP